MTPDVTPGRVTERRAPAKLTLTLRVTGIRPDGYHLLDAEMVTVSLADRLVVSEGDGLDGLELVMGTTGGLPVPDGPHNSVRRALLAVGRRAHVRLEKHIPAGAGLGGGSADAAAVLRWAGRRDAATAMTIGADVPFCVVGGRARVRGAGEVVEPMPFEHRRFTLLVPPFGVPTPAVYRAWDEMGGPVGAEGNDLEPAAIGVVPELARWRDRLGGATGAVPRLAGSGSTWFVEGEFPGEGRLVVRTVGPQEME